MAAAGVAAVLATGGVGGTAALGGGAAESGAGTVADAGVDAGFESDVDSAALRELRRRTERAARSAKNGKRTRAWRRMRLRRGKHTHGSDSLGCVAWSYGRVRDFLRRHRCRSLHRRLFVLLDPSGDTILVSRIRMVMRHRRDVYRLKDVFDVYGSGDVRPLGGSLLDLGDVRFTGKHYSSRHTGRSLIVAESEPVGGDPSDAFLKSVARVAVSFPVR